MGIQLTGLNSPTTVAVADATFDALRITPRPMENFNWQSITTYTGNQTLTAAWVANSGGTGTIWNLRNVGPGYVAIRKVQVGFRCTTGFTAGQLMDYGLLVNRNHVIPFNAGGTALIVNNGTALGKLDRRSSAASISIYTATTAGLTAITLGGIVQDTNYIGYVNWWNPTTTTGAHLPMNTILFESLPGEMPLILRPYESASIINITVMGTAGVGIASINCEFAEISTFALSTTV